MADPILAEAEELYALLPAEFTAARDARAKALKGEDAQLSARVKGLKKPSLGAWVLNHLVRHEAGQVDEVLAVGRALREAQDGLDAAALRELTKQRRQLTAAVTTRARRLAREAGHQVTEQVAEQVEAALTAAMIDETCAAVVRSGLLVAGVRATAPGSTDPEDPARAAALPEAAGFLPRTVAGSGVGEDGDEASAGGAASLRVVPDPDAAAKARAAAEEALAEAREALEAAEGEAGEGDAAVAELEARGLQLQSGIDEHRRALAELEEQAEETDDDLEQAEAVQAEAHDRLAAARRAADAAAAALERLR